MKEVTYEDWLKNPTPRMMWVWNDDFEEREKKKVVYIIKDDFASCPVLAVSEEDSSFCVYCCCAEIEESKTRRMTNKELSRWLREKPTREYKYRNNGTNDGFAYYVYSYLSYLEETKADEEVSASILIREDDGEWREPLVEIEE